MTQTTTSLDDRLSFSELIARPGAIEVLVFAAAVLAFIASSAFQFIYDDRAQILANSGITSWRGVFAYFGSDVWTSYDPSHPHNYYRPLFFVWFRLNYLFFRLQPGGWHVAAVLLHALASLLAFRMLLKLTADRFISAVAALLFAVHPVHIESVAWISGATDPLMCVFLFGAALLFLQWLEQGSAARLVASAVLFAFALLCKEPAIMLVPFLALAVWMACGRRLSPRAALGRGVLPLALVAAAYLAVRAHVLHGAAHSVDQLSWAQLLCTLPSVVLFYLRQSLMPIGLSFVYEMPVQSALSGQFFWMPLLVLLGAAALFAFWCYRAEGHRATLVAAAALWMLWLLPVLNLRWLPAGELVHDRYLYLPVLGICMMAAVFLRQWEEASEAARQSAAQQKPLDATRESAAQQETSQDTLAAPWVPQAIAAALLVAALFAGTVSQELDCASDLLLWTRAYRVAPNNEIVLSNLATALFERGRMQDGFALMQKELALNPNSANANYNMGYALHNVQDDSAAEPFAARAVELAPYKAEAVRLLGTIELCLGRPGPAEQLMRQAVALAPTGDGYHSALAVVLMERGDRAGAERELLEELRLHPQSAIAAEALTRLRSQPH